MTGAIGGGTDTGLRASVARQSPTAVTALQTATTAAPREGARTLSALRRLDHILRSVTPADGNARRDGLDGGTLSQVRERCSHLPEPMRGWWRRIEDNLLSYTAPAGREGWFLEGSARE